MSDNGVQVIDYLREQFSRLNQRMDRSDRKLDELTVRVGALDVAGAGIKRDIAELHGVTAHLSVRVDSLDARLERMERRLNLVDGPPA